MTDTEPGFERLSKCTITLQHWFWKNDLLLHPDKSDVALYGTRPDLKRPGLPSSISITGCAINVSKGLKILGVTLDATLSYHQCGQSMQYGHACPAPHPLQHQTRHRKYHSAQHHREQVKLLELLLFDALVKTVSRLQHVQNNLARIVFDIGIIKLHDSGRRTGDLLRELHWLPVQFRIVYKVALLYYKSYKLWFANISVIAATTVYAIAKSALVHRRPGGHPSLKNQDFLASFLLGGTTRLERSARHRPICPQYWFIPNSA